MHGNFERDDGSGNNWSGTTSCMIISSTIISGTEKGFAMTRMCEALLLRDADGPEGFVGPLVIAGLIRTG